MTEAPLVPYDWQEADIRKIVKTIGTDVGALVVSAPGAGKTLVATEAARRLNPGVVLIIAPPSTHGSWARTLARQGVTGELKPLIGTKPGKANFEALRWGRPGYYITSVQWFTRQDWKNIQPEMVIFDEIHMAVTYGNASTKKLIGYGKMNGLQAKYRIALSGTPFRNNFENMWALVRWVQPSAINSNYWVWRITECVGKYDHFAPQNLKVTGERVPGKLVSSLGCYIWHAQRTRCCKFHPKGFLGHLAPPIQIERDLEMTKNQAEFYRTMESSYVAYLTSPDGSGKVPFVTEFPIAARSRLRFCALGMPSLAENLDDIYFADDCESPKLEALIQDLSALDGKRALVLTHSLQFAQVTQRRLAAAGFSVGLIGGGLSAKRRTEMIRDFQNDKYDAIVGVISAMGTGTDGLQEAAYNVMWLSVDDDASNVTQGIGRLDRLGQKHQVVMIEYRMKNTFDVGYLDKQIVRQLELNKSLKGGK